MHEKHIRATERTWSKLRSEAFRQRKNIKDVLDGVMEGQIDPTKIEIL